MGFPNGLEGISKTLVTRSVSEGSSLFFLSLASRVGLPLAREEWL